MICWRVSLGGFSCKHQTSKSKVYTLENERQEPKSRLIEKENHLNQTIILGIHVSFRGYIF